jgi:DNA-binding XRE family transcriptional regulator
MMTVQLIKTQSGDEMVIMPRADYEALVAAASEAEEDAADRAMFDRRMAEFAANSGDVLPAEVSLSLLKGVRLIKALRKWRGLTQVTVAEAADIRQGYLSDIESGRRQGTAETLGTIAKALDVPPRWLTAV